VESERVVYRSEVIGLLFGVSDIPAEVRRIRSLLEEDDGEEEEEEHLGE
jgi:hypothetical protein